MRARLPVLAAALAVVACAGTPRGAPGGAGDGAPHASQVSITGLDGGTTALGAVLGSKPALVSFWAPWCEPCVRELPQLERLAQAAGPCGAAVLGVAVGERPESIGPFCRARHLTFPQYTDESFALADALGQRRIPAIVVFDRAGAIVYKGDALDARATAALAAASGGGSNCALR
ncbi:MAG: Thiol:disulfide oxidoreductase related to ResA [Myxococcales bacterium]|nr:Thiol:disulfide oxidoreductase related to ResA [Myxococcales bacterium]